MFFFSDLIDYSKEILLTMIAIACLVASPFAFAGIMDSFLSDLGPVWTESANTGFLPDSH